MKNFSFLIASMLLALCVQAQAPQKFSYQTVVRNASNQLLVGQNVGIKISILQGSANGSAVYAETHTPQTNANGLATLEIGGGTLLSGSFANINWASGNFFVKTETDPNGGNNYTITNISQLLSVPYALYAANGLPSNGTNGQTLTNCNGVATWTTAGQCPGTIASINCSGASNTGTLTALQAASGVNSNISYTGGGGGTHSGQTVTSTGVIGLTATCAAGNLTTGAGSLTYSITGTPLTSGAASFALNIGGQTCSLARTVNLPVGTITALSCSTATNTGTLTQGIAAASVSSSIPYTGGNSGTYSAQNISSTGVSGLTASLTTGNFANGGGSLTYSITGTPASSGTASFALSIGGQTCTLTRAVSLPSGTITSLNCSTAINSGTLTQGIAATSVSSSVSYSGGNSGTYTAQTILSTGVTGLTATIAAGTLLSGAGTLTLTITGTPAISGTASFALSIGGQNCTLTRTVVLPVGFISALTCSSATNTGTLTQGIVAATVNCSVPYTGGNGGTYSAQNISSTGVTGLTASLTAGNFASGGGSLTYSITGTPASSGTASFALSIGGQSCSLARSVLPIGSITALNCASVTNNGNLIQGVAASSVSSNVPYTGGNGGSYIGQTINSTGVLGLTATLASGTLAGGGGILTFIISGTPSSNGTAGFVLNFGGQTCTLNRTVNIPLGTISVLNCDSVTNSGILRQGNAAISVFSSVPYLGSNGGTYSGQIVSSTGVSGLTATLNAGNFFIGEGNLTYTITGTPSSSGTAIFILNIGGQICTLTRSIFSLGQTGVTQHSCGTGNIHNSNLPYGTMVDQEGNTYRTIVIGNKEWMAENLKTSSYRNGEPIDFITDNADWIETTSGAWCYYENNSVNECPNGKLYNYFAVSDQRKLCPTGWDVPTRFDFAELISIYDSNFVIDIQGGICGPALKSQGGWAWWPTVSNTNESGFSATQSHSRGNYGEFYGEFTIYDYNEGKWWGSSLFGNPCALILSYQQNNTYLSQLPMNHGLSVRCIRN